MIHTATLTLLASTSLLATASGARPQDSIEKSTQSPEVKGIIDRLKGRERALKSVALDMLTWGSYPSGLTFRTKGQLRVLGTTHFHIDVESTFESATRTRMEKVITPEGVWTHEDGPLENVYTFMKPDKMRELQEAQADLAADRRGSMRNPSPLAGNGESPLGSAMLEVLSRQFELELDPKTTVVDGVPCQRLGGVWRGFTGLAPDETPPWQNRLDPRAVHRVEVLLRAADGIPIRFVHYTKVIDEKAARKGEDLTPEDFKDAESFWIRIENLKLDPPLKESDFELQDVPEGTVFQDVMEHQTSKAQINQILEDWQDLKKRKAEDAKKAQKNGKNGKNG